VPLQFQPYQSFDYPTHPFSEHLTGILGRVPGGFVDLALSGLLSLQAIEMLDIASKAFSQSETSVKDGAADEAVHQPSPTTRVGFLCLAILRNRRCNVVEEILAISLLAYCISTGEVVDGYFSLLHGFVQVHSMGIWDVPLELRNWELDQYGINDFLLWAKMVLMATFDHDTQTFRIAVKLRTKIPLRDFRLRHFDTGQRYFWSDNLTSRLKVRVGRERITGKR
jgi:hypothetical protein